VTQADAPASGSEAAFLAALPLIDRIVAVLARRHAMDAAQADEFQAWARARLIDDDYAVFRKFGGRSSLGTYLTVVITNLHRDYRNQQWGRWRPSAAATHLGPLAIQLETLVHRDGHPVREAIGILEARGVARSAPEMRRLLAQLPARARPREVDIEVVADAAAPGRPDDALWESEAALQRGTTLGILRDLLGAMSPEDQVIVRMHFWDDVSIADIARTLHIEQRPLYRRLDSIRALLRAGMERAGIGRAQAAELIDADQTT
jgi:RNA polymerase sigma factor (sigma-70 family)